MLKFLDGEGGATECEDGVEGGLLIQRQLLEANAKVVMWLQMEMSCALQLC